MIGRLDSLRNSVNRISGKISALESRRDSLQDEILSLKESEIALAKVCALYRVLVDSEITAISSILEDLHSEALSSIFTDRSLSAKSEVKVSRGKVSLSLLTQESFSDGTLVEGDSLSFFGGAVWTVQSVLLRILVILHRGLRPVIFLDESLPAFDPEYSAKVGEFLNSLCDKLGFSILMVTHNPVIFESSKNRFRVKRGSDDSARFLVS